ncbi:hypothetical protein OCGS_1757 [Oceaniovalibus guishaninsula JLT2003]|uniref:Polyketide cyclase / dehydrase and lipid transport n=1 Tax=Oceaniovalibus guishaninsula JLT2003 TaxID=1231392 RepID=K2GNM1_9RHOB|nr:SRPBCC family protein [Oceaniovalibus guishaninsula]EKE44241.1 hypothetical protein OCGS_1757 [Oceaniovalibus guishaninsula JLT2003]
MILTSTTDIALPPLAVFDGLADFALFEALLRERGIDVARTDHGSDARQASWRLQFDRGGKRRDMGAHVTALHRPSDLALEGVLDGVAIRPHMRIEALDQDRSRLTVTIEARPMTVYARVLLQPLKLAAGTLNRRLDARLDDLARRLERRAGPT